MTEPLSITFLTPSLALLFFGHIVHTILTHLITLVSIKTEYPVVHSHYVSLLEMELSRTFETSPSARLSHTPWMNPKTKKCHVSFCVRYIWSYEHSKFRHISYMPHCVQKLCTSSTAQDDGNVRKFADVSNDRTTGHYVCPKRNQVTFIDDGITPY